MAPDFLKVDRSLVSHVDGNRSKQAALAAIVTFARGMNCKVIAEGIERKAELETVMGLGVVCGQGFFLGRPDKGLHGGFAKAREMIRLSGVPLPAREIRLTTDTRSRSD
ncbi:hypothetical protein JCM14719A_08140 [Calditerricola satsumensis]|uniref:EAL domain-containing protein n=1 Tax=Calditerricola satsumensis TaxID=373054 RepID=A0A8J3FCX8_9BACI|nr:EAL domain-containing protein [Calditerricola satsumensis]GGK02094.1 hypothetical protein GCM10007043_15230 [Calditerricola satsumensis]